MIAKQNKHQPNIWSRFKRWVKPSRQVFLTSFGVAGCIVLLRFSGLLQASELAALDRLFLWRPPEPPDDRVAIVEINEDDLSNIGQHPIPDRVMAELLTKLNRNGAKLIGLDIYRNFPVKPGSAELQAVFQTLPNLIAIKKIADKNVYGSEIAAPPGVPEEQVGFNNVQYDSDGKVRRNLLYLWTEDRQTHTSFALRLALKYLAEQQIELKANETNPWNLQLGKTSIQRFEPNDGSYVRADRGGYQILVNFSRIEGRFQTWSMTDVLADRVPAEQMRDRIVLIGSTAKSVKDFFYTPYSGGFLQSSPQKISGVELHANFLSQILSAAIDGRTLLLKFWPDPVEWGWILIWSFAGAYFSWRWRSPYRNLIGIAILEGGLLLTCYLAFLFSWWLPLIPASLALAGSAIVITSYLAHLEEEFKRSKDFLQGIINTVADPIFVKDRNHKWIVLNQAFASLIGYPIKKLINNSPEMFFPPQEAEIFLQQAEQVFTSGQSSEHEENFTDFQGNTYLMATKRSLHQDAGGNLFLVGVLRDITERKQMEEELRRTAAELTRSNEELQLSHSRLRYMAYHDTLTGLPNRKLFYERLIQSLEWAEFNQQAVALMFLDLDGFKNINDNYGHSSGDELLKTVATRLKNCLRGTDTVSRLAGDEFTVILPAIVQTSNVAIVAEKILATVKDFILVHDEKNHPHEVNVTASIGISLYPQDGKNPDELIKLADKSMYESKNMGKNKYTFYSSLTIDKMAKNKIRPIATDGNGRTVAESELSELEHPDHKNGKV